jgi:putative addiction module killer protein
MHIRVEEYIRPDGSSPYADWFNGLDAQAAAKVVTAKLRMELGNTSNVKWFSGIGEYVIDWGPGYRIYLAKDGDSLIVLFGGGTKRRQQADIERAKALHAEIQRQEGCGSGGNQEQAAEEVSTMALTRDFKETVLARVERDPTFAKKLLDEATMLLTSGEPQTARVILRDLVNATVGFEQLAKITDVPSKSLHRMLSPRGNPSMDNLAAIFGAVSSKISRNARATRQPKVA